jgi:hypothetical protein
MTTVIIIVLVVAAVLVIAGAVAAFVIDQDKKRRRVREDFGPEYHRELARTGDRGRAQKELEERQKRVASFDLKPLSAEDSRRFSDQWRSTQERFVDDPKSATRDADGLIQEVMETRGYPVSDFDQRAADISVDHPEIVQNYRSAHQISEANDRGEASTEDLRQAFVHYRSLFQDLLETEDAPVEAEATRPS